MQGTIKFFNEEKNFGYISVNDQEGDLHFNKSSLIDKELVLIPEAAVEFDSKELKLNDGESRVTATNLRRQGISLESKGQYRLLHGRAEGFLEKWAFIVLFDRTTNKGKEITGCLPDLANLALTEQWYFGPVRDDDISQREKYRILSRYIKITFHRLYQDKLVAFSGNGQFACFNTGLVDEYYDPIFALFEKSNFEWADWKYVAFTTSGRKPYGQTISSNFRVLPARARFLNSDSNIVFDSALRIDINWKHCLYENIGRDRLPFEFYERLPRTFPLEDFREFSKNDRQAYLSNLEERIEADENNIKESFHENFNSSIMKAKKRAEWNYRMAIPQYYPFNESINILLPLQLGNTDQIDAALVIQRKGKSSAYYAPTMLTKQMAYENARVICKPDTDWLSIENIEIEIEDDSEDQIDDYADLLESEDMHAETNIVKESLSPVHTSAINSLNTPTNSGQLESFQPQSPSVSKRPSENPPTDEEVLKEEAHKVLRALKEQQGSNTDPLQSGGDKKVKLVERAQELMEKLKILKNRS